MPRALAGQIGLVLTGISSAGGLHPEEDGIPLAIDQLAAHVEQLGAVGVDEAGIRYRPLYSGAWVEATELIARWAREAGLAVRRDAVGNVLARLEGTASGRTILVGSHVDTVRDGGAFDGAAGIHAGLFAVAGLLEAHGRPQRSIEVVALCEEEGERFPGDLWGSRAILGRIDPTEAGRLEDAEGTTMAEAMRAVGLDPGAVGTAVRRDLDAFLELHIEQGPVLESQGAAVGIVDAIVGVRHLNLEIRGKQGHAGTMPMAVRHDPVAAAAAIVTEVDRWVQARGHPAVTTCGRFEVEPGSVNVIARRVRLSFDSRHPEAGALEEQHDRLDAMVAEECRRRGVTVTTLSDVRHGPRPLDVGIRQRFADAAAALGISAVPISSGAGHDSLLFSRHIPTGLLFVPSVGGVSHSPAEYTTPEQLATGVQVLAGTLRSLAYGGRGSP